MPFTRYCSIRVPKAWLICAGVPETVTSCALFVVIRRWALSSQPTTAARWAEDGRNSAPAWAALRNRP